MKRKNIQSILPILVSNFLLFSCGGGDTPTPPPSGPKFESSITLVYPHGNSLSEQRLANELKTSLQQENVNVVVQDDSLAAPEKAVLIGLTSYSTTIYPASTGTYAVNNNENYIELVGDNNGSSALIDGTSYLKAQILEAKRKDISIFNQFETSYTELYNNHALRFMSFNVLNGNKTGSSGMVYLSDRIPAAAAMVNAHNPDVMGCQEYNANWYNSSPNFESLINSSYKKIGGVRDYSAPGAECSPIFYNSSTVELIDHGTLWPSSTLYTPNTQVSSTMYPRVFTYGFFRHISDGKIFLFLNTHLDLNETARLEQIKVMENFAKDYYSQMPVFITGDYNDEYHNTGDDPYIRGHATDWLIDEKGYQNPAFVARVKDSGYTFPSPTFNAESNRKIDYCLHYGEGVIDKYHAVDRNRYNNRDYSDHYAIYVDLDVYNPLNSSYLPYDTTSYPYSGTYSVEYNNSYVSELPFRLDAPAAFQNTNGEWLNANDKGSEFGAIKALGNIDNGFIEYRFDLLKAAPGDLDLHIASTKIDAKFNMGGVTCLLNGQTIDLSDATLPSATGWYDESHVIIKNVPLRKGTNILKMQNKGEGVPNQLNLRVYTQAPSDTVGYINGLNTNVVQKNNKVYYVHKGLIQGKAEERRIFIDLIKNSVNHASGKEINITIDEHGHFTYEVDVSSLGTGSYYPHAVINGESFDKNKGDIKYVRQNPSDYEGQQIPNTATISYGGKTYKIIQRSWMPTLDIA